MASPLPVAFAGGDDGPAALCNFNITESYAMSMAEGDQARERMETPGAHLWIARDAKGALIDITAPSPALQAILPGAKAEKLFARTMPLSELRRVVGEECALPIARKANFLAGWAFTDEAEQLITGLRIPLYREKDKSKHGHRQLDRTVNQGFTSYIFTLDGPDLLVTLDGFLARQDVLLFAVLGGGQAVPLLEASADLHAGSLGELASRVRSVQMRKMTRIGATVSPEGALRTVIKGESPDRKDIEVHVPDPAPGATTRLYLPDGFRLYEVNGWPVVLEQNMWGKRMWPYAMVPVGPCRVVVQLVGRGTFSLPQAIEFVAQEKEDYGLHYRYAEADPRRKEIELLVSPERGLGLR
jgi:hypothetical protein